MNISFIRNRENLGRTREPGERFLFLSQRLSRLALPLSLIAQKFLLVKETPRKERERKREREKEHTKYLSVTASLCVCVQCESEKGKAYKVLFPALANSLNVFLMVHWLPAPEKKIENIFQLFALILSRGTLIESEK